MAEAPFVWQQQIWQQLNQWHEQDTTPHALLFVGAWGLGGQALMESFAKLLLCTGVDKPCGECTDCIAFDNHEHSAVTTLGFDEASNIGVDEVRAWDKLHLKSNQKKIVMIEAGKLNVNAANACLKMLEEPHPGTYFLLRVDSVGVLNPTIISRCVKMTLPVPTKAQALSFFEGTLPEEEAARLLTLFDNQPIKAHHYAQEPNLILRKSVLDDWAGLVEGTAPFEVFDKWAKEDVQEALYLIYSFMQDVCLLAVGGESTSVKNQDYLAKITDCAKQMSPAKLFCWMQTWQKAVKDIRIFNVKAQYALFNLAAELR